MSRPQRSASPLATTLSEENLNEHNRRSTASPSPRKHMRNRHLTSTAPATGHQDQSSSSHSSRNYAEMVHDNMAVDEEDSSQAPPPSPRPTQGSFDNADTNNNESPSTPRRAMRYLMMNESGEYIGQDHTSFPTRPPSRASVSRPSVSRSFSETDDRNMPSTDNDEDDEESEVRRILYEDEEAELAQDARSPIVSLRARSLSSTLTNYSIAPPSFPTKTSYDKIPDLKETSVAGLTQLTNFVLSARANFLLHPWTSDQHAEFLESLSDWRTLLKGLCEVETPAQSGARHSDATYAFTRTTINAAYKTHGEIYEKLGEIAAGLGLGLTGIDGDIAQVIEDNNRVWGFIMIAWQSDKANEVSGASWCYGEVDWKRGVDNPVAVGWSGGEAMKKPAVPAWPGKQRDDLKDKESENRGAK